jgi:hypothetical protein
MAAAAIGLTWSEVAFIEIQKANPGVSPKKIYRGGKPLQMQHGCSHCGYGQLGGIPKGYAFCPCCHKPLKQEKTLRLELGRTL